MRTLWSSIAFGIAIVVAACGRTGLVASDDDTTMASTPPDGGTTAATDAAHRDSDAPPGADAAPAPDDPSTPPWELDGGVAADASCEGQTLNSGACLVTLATGQDSPGGIAIDATNVYWTTGARASGAGTVAKVARNGGATTTIATGQWEPRDVATDGTNVYWSGRSVHSAPVGGGAVHTVFDDLNSETKFVTRNGARLYWAVSQSDFGLKSALPDGSQLAKLSGYLEIGGLAASTRGIVYTEQSDTSGVPSRLVSLTFGGDISILRTTDASLGLVRSAYDVVVFVENYKTIYSVPLDGGTPTFLASNVYLADLVTDGTYVYWTDGDRGVVRLPLGPGAPEVIVSVAETGVRADGALTIDAHSVYFTDASARKVFKLTPR